MTHLDLDPLTFGTGDLGNLYREMSDEVAWSIVETAWNGGIRSYDTAPHYGLGLAERRLGAFLQTKPRDSYVLSTKAGRLLRPNPGGEDRQDDENFAVPATTRRVWDPTPAGVRASLEESLTRLGLDRVDILYLHDLQNYDLEEGIAVGLPACAELRDEGLVDAVGVGTGSVPALLADGGAALPAPGAGRPHSRDQRHGPQADPRDHRPDGRASARGTVGASGDGGAHSLSVAVPFDRLRAHQSVMASWAARASSTTSGIDEAYLVRVRHRDHRIRAPNAAPSPGAAHLGWMKHDPDPATRVDADVDVVEEDVHLLLEAVVGGGLRELAGRAARARATTGAIRTRRCRAAGHHRSPVHRGSSGLS
jgi:hypothetical protein